MLNPTIKRFKQQLDEVLVLRRILLEKQSKITCEAVRADDERMLAFDENMAIEFAFEMNIPVKVEKRDSEAKRCRYRYTFTYEDMKLAAYSSAETYKSFKKAGWVS